jgi:hypothetical protein
MSVEYSPIARSLLLALVLLTLGIVACDDSVTPDEPPRISITQPADSAIVADSVLRIMTEVMVKCGCNSHVEFLIDGVHLYSDYFPYFSFDWNTDGYDRGWHTIATRLVVRDVGEAWDSVAVFISRGDSLRSSSSPGF